MPPYVPIFFAMVAYLIVACIVWAVACFLLISSSTRTLGKKIAYGMAGSFPGVFVFQILSVPIFLLVILGMNIIGLIGRPPNLILVFTALFLVSIPLVASLLGFYTGWRVGWELAAGRSSRALLCNDPILAPILRFLAKHFRSLDRRLR